MLRDRPRQPRKKRSLPARGPARPCGSLIAVCAIGASLAGRWHAQSQPVQSLGPPPFYFMPANRDQPRVGGKEALRLSGQRADRNLVRMPRAGIRMRTVTCIRSTGPRWGSRRDVRCFPRAVLTARCRPPEGATQQVPLAGSITAFTAHEFGWAAATRGGAPRVVTAAAAPFEGGSGAASRRGVARQTLLARARVGLRWRSLCLRSCLLAGARRDVRAGLQTVLMRRPLPASSPPVGFDRETRGLQGCPLHLARSLSQTSPCAHGALIAGAGRRGRAHHVVAVDE